MKIKVVIADDHPILLEGVAHVLSNIQTIEVVGKALDSTAVMELLGNTSCDILVTDYAMPGGQFGDGINFISFVKRRYPRLKIIVFTMIENVAIARELKRLGVDSVVSKRGNVDGVLLAIREINAGRQYFPSESNALLIEAQEVRGNKHKALSKREAEVVRLYISGLTIGEIATQLKRTKQTISSQKVNAMLKLGLTNDAALFRLAFDAEGNDASMPHSDTK